MQSSRRAFLLGRPAPRTPWQVFCQRLRRACGGELQLIHGDASAPSPPSAPSAPSAPSTDPQGRWTPVLDEDVRQARALCAEYGVQLALVDTPVSVAGRPVLWVDPAQLNCLAREPGPSPRWRAGPGVTLGALARAGLAQFAQAPPERMLAAWFADRGAAAGPLGGNELAGVHAADVLLADGVADTLGPFGAQGGQPLRSAALQRLVPKLFGLAASPEARWCREQSEWPAHYRLDALLPDDPEDLNLARLLHGHGGTLAWLESLVLQTPVSAVTSSVMSPVTSPVTSAVTSPVTSAVTSAVTSPVTSAVTSAVTSLPGATAMPSRTDVAYPPARARALDARVKSCFDPAGVFPDLA
jgi:hypothetical protein